MIQTFFVLKNQSDLANFILSFYVSIIRYSIQFFIVSLNNALSVDSWHRF